jgi:hypothetical protein
LLCTHQHGKTGVFFDIDGAYWIHHYAKFNAQSYSLFNRK